MVREGVVMRSSSISASVDGDCFMVVSTVSRRSRRNAESPVMMLVRAAAGASE